MLVSKIPYPTLLTVHFQFLLTRVAVIPERTLTERH
jgi:hypothetical protein